MVKNIFKNGIYWVPLIGAYTGARREEIAGLAPSDIIEVEGICCFTIEDSELRRIKNLSSRRLIPIHSHLIELGFLDYIQKAIELGRAALDVGVPDAEVFDMPMELGLELVAIVSAHFPNAERELFDDVVNEVDCVCLSVFLVDLERADSRCIVDRCVLETAHLFVHLFL